MAKENNKQALITTHNPAILDGLNLHDDAQRLFVVYRSDEGDTRVRRIKHKEHQEVGGHPLKLSELWMRGFLGGIPRMYSSEERAAIAAELLASMDDPEDDDADAGWATEIERRARRVLATPSPGISLTLVPGP